MAPSTAKFNDSLLESETVLLVTKIFARTKTSPKTEATTSGLQKMKTNLCPESESVSAQKKREIMEDLVKGHKAATELRLLLQNPFGTEPSLSSHHLIAKVLRSFTQALTIIHPSPLAPASADGLAHRNPLFSGKNGPSVPRSGNCSTSGDCSEKRSKKGGRGRYNRSAKGFYCSVTGTRTLLRLLIRIITERFDELGCVRIKSVLTWTELSYTTDDNHAWRKYGQKKILNSEFPRGLRVKTSARTERAPPLGSSKRTTRFGFNRKQIQHLIPQLNFHIIPLSAINDKTNHCPDPLVRYIRGVRRSAGSEAGRSQTTNRNLNPKPMSTTINTGQRSQVGSRYPPGIRNTGVRGWSQIADRPRRRNCVGLELGPIPEQPADRIIHGAALYLLEGGVELESIRPTPPGGWPVVRGYDWAPHDVGTYESEFQSRGVLLEWANQSFVARDEADAQLIRLGEGDKLRRFLFRVYISVSSHDGRRPEEDERCPRPTTPERLGLYPGFHGGVFGVRRRAFDLRFLSLLPRPVGYDAGLGVVDVHSAGEFVDPSGEPLFPFYWTEEPSRITPVPACDLTPSERDAVKLINDLPRRLPTLKLVECLCHEDFINVAPRKTKYVPPTQKKDPRLTVGGDVKIPPPKPTFKFVHRGTDVDPTPVGIPLTAATGAAEVAPTNPPPGSAPQVTVADTGKTAAGLSNPPLADAPRKKKKRSKEGEKSSSKRSKRDHTPQPLPGGLMDPAFGVSDRLDFRMSSAQREIMEQLSEQQLLKATLEHSSRGAMLMWYAERFADRRGLDAIQRELASEKKAAAEAKASLEAFTLEHSNCESERTGLQRKLADACAEVETLTQKLNALGLKYEAEREESSRQRAALAEANKKVSTRDEELVEMHAENIRLQGEQQQAADTIARLNQDIQLEHEEGFFKAIRQAAYFFNFDPTSVDFDLGMDVHKGKMAPLSEIPGEEDGAPPADGS
ncbi:hypothetical protein V8G54_037262 [Vigna mungo]|uniref:WRKY domain-containing protein n=1 Tax=Vigna mungo TaxID=3915 RepID=A0AAQ3MJ87_VIGMU